MQDNAFPRMAASDIFKRPSLEERKYTALINTLIVCNAKIQIRIF